MTENRGDRAGLADIALGLMALAAGSTDAMAFLKLGTVFTSAMTGNTVLMCVAIGQGRLSAALLSFAAFVSFIAGAMLAAALCSRRIGRDAGPPPLWPPFGVEIACLAGFVAAWFFADRAQEGSTYLLVALSAVAMGVQGVAARQINVSQINTIVFTTTIVTVCTSVTHALMRPPRRLPFDTKRQIAVLAVYGAGAAAAAVSIQHADGVYVWLPLGAVIAAVACYEWGRRGTTLHDKR
jgi:uncharacterized membrane protein YoaK (UPF0700 family)